MFNRIKLRSHRSLQHVLKPPLPIKGLRKRAFWDSTFKTLAITVVFFLCFYNHLGLKHIAIECSLQVEPDRILTNQGLFLIQEGANHLKIGCTQPKLYDTTSFIYWTRPMKKKAWSKID